MRTFSLALAAFALCAPAAAQDGSETATARTPAGAQRFLSTAAKQNNVLLDPTAEQGATIEWHYRRYNVVPEADCVSRFEVDPASGYFSERNVGSLNKLVSDPANAAAFSAFLKKYRLTLPPYRVQWSPATRISRSRSCGPNCTGEEWRFIRLDGITLWYPDEDWAKRAEFAMKFLAETCRPPEVEGF